MNKARWFFSSKKRALVLVIVLLLFGYLGYKQFLAKPQAPEYQTAQVEKGTLIESVSASGQVSSANNTSISTQASGVVTKVYVENGQEVKTGDKIAELDLDLDGKLRNTQGWASYQSAKNSLDSANVTLYTLDSAMWSAQRTFMNDAVTRGLATYDPTYIQQNDNWLAAEAKYKNQQNVVMQAQTALSSAWLSYQQSSPEILAPISGTVTGLSLQPGMVLLAQSNTSGGATSQKIASIKTNAPAQVSVSLTEIDVNKVKIGNKVILTLDALPGKTFTGKVISIDTIGQVTSGVTTYPAVIGLDSQVQEILPNMATAAKIITNVIDNVVLVPNSAVSASGGENIVKVVKDNKVSELQVEVAGSNDTQTGISQGLKEGDVVVISVSTTGATGTQRQGTSSVFGGFGGGGVMIRR